MIYIYRLIRLNIDQFLYILYRKNILWLGLPLSIFARKFFLREFLPIKKNYSSLEELNSIVKKEFEMQMTNKLLENLKEQSEWKTTSIKGKKVFFIFSARVKNNKKNIPGNFIDWVNSAKFAGCKTEKFDATNISYNYNQSEISELDSKNILKSDTKKLVKKISKFQPDLIFLDSNYAFNSRTINSETIRQIRLVSSAKITGIADDMYTDAAFASVERWATFLDVVFFSAPGWSNRSVRNILFVPYTSDPYRFYPARKKNKNLFFSGIGNIPRYGYLFAAKRYCLNNNINHYIQPHKREAKYSLSRKRFDRYIRESTAVLEATARSSTVRPTGGRTYNSIACKTLLIMEKTKQMNGVLVPYIHYIPFDSIKELEIAIQFSNESKLLTNKITNNAYQYYKKYYEGDKVWQLIFLFSSNPEIINKPKKNKNH